MTTESTFTKDGLEPAVYSVSEFNAVVSHALSLEFGSVWLRGEISTLTKAASGHYYLSLKDELAVVKAVIFRARRAYCEFEPRVGDQVEVQAKVGLYEPRGEFQLNIQQLRRAGRGTLHEQYEALKLKLRAEGLFDASNKRSPVQMPRALGVITSLGAAALHDVLTSLRRRAPYVGVVIYPSLVQGQAAPLALRQALARANERMEVDTILLVRGGGSLEDLWAFNDESLARDIAASTIPVICGVGHESDVTIADFVADVRAATPTAAAELSCESVVSLSALVSKRVNELSARVARLFERLSQRLDKSALRLVSPSQRLAAQGHQLASLSQRLRFAAPNIEAIEGRRLRAIERFRELLAQSFQSRQIGLQGWQARLQALSPTAPLARGFAIVRDPTGQILRHSSGLSVGDELVIELEKDEVRATVKSLSGSDQEG